MTTWQTIFGVDQPIRGKVSQFAAARDTFDDMATDAQNVVDQFANFSDPSFVADNLNDAPGSLLTQMLSTVDDGLHVLPRVAGEARDIFAAHHDRLVELGDEADGALARARTAWERKNELVGQQSSLQSQIDSLNSQIDGAADDADTTDLDSDLSGAESSLGSINGELTSVQATLDGIYGNDDSEYNGLRGAEDSRDDTTVDELGGIDLGALEDPGFWDKVGDVLGSIGNFLGGILESLANLVEAFVSGDWATFFWELKNLLDAALLILGTIALFTGIGGPLGLLLIGLAVASFAVNTGLYATQTPNPQTGQTVGLTDVVVSGVGVAFAGVTALQVIRRTTALNVAAGSIGPQANHTMWSTFRAMNAPGFRQGALYQFLGNSGTNLRNGANAFYNRFRPSVSGGAFPVTPTWRVPYGTDGPLPFPINAATPASWELVTTVAPLPGSEGTAVERVIDKASAGGFDAYNMMYTPGLTGGYGSPGVQGTPVFGPDQPSPQQVEHVLTQAVSSPDVHIIPAIP